MSAELVRTPARSGDQHRRHACSGGVERLAHEIESRAGDVIGVRCVRCGWDSPVARCLTRCGALYATENGCAVCADAAAKLQVTCGNCGVKYDANDGRFGACSEDCAVRGPLGRLGT